MAGTFVLEKVEQCSNRGPSATKQLCPGEGGAFSFMEPAEKGQFSRRGLSEEDIFLSGLAHVAW